jgi:Domain of unknown function (DUF4124)
MHKTGSLHAAALAALIGLTATQGFAAERVYKWVDAQGVVHYGQQPPAETRAEAITVQKGFSAPDPQATAEPTAEQKQQAADAETCHVATENFKMLSGDGPVKRKDEYGSEHLLSPEEKSAEKERAHAAMDKFCKPAVATQPGATPPATPAP